MFDHMLTHVESLQTQNIIRLSHAEADHPVQIEKSTYHNFALLCKRDFEQHDAVPII